MQECHDDLGFTGMKFFTVTRSVLLTVSLIPFKSSFTFYPLRLILHDQLFVSTKYILYLPYWPGSWPRRDVCCTCPTRRPTGGLHGVGIDRSVAESGVIDRRTSFAFPFRLRPWQTGPPPCALRLCLFTVPA